jgi:hypothetical protein
LSPAAIALANNSRARHFSPVYLFVHVCIYFAARAVSLTQAAEQMCVRLSLYPRTTGSMKAITGSFIGSLHISERILPTLLLFASTEKRRSIQYRSRRPLQSFTYTDMSEIFWHRKRCSTFHVKRQCFLSAAFSLTHPELMKMSLFQLRIKLECCECIISFKFALVQSAKFNSY